MKFRYVPRTSNKIADRVAVLANGKMNQTVFYQEPIQAIINLLVDDSCFALSERATIPTHLSYRNVSFIAKKKMLN